LDFFSEPDPLLLPLSSEEFSGVDTAASALLAPHTPGDKIVNFDEEGEVLISLLPSPSLTSDKVG